MKTNLAHGLTDDEVKLLREQFGRNEIIVKEVSTLRKFLKKLIGPIPLMIEAAMVLSAVAGKWEDFWIIFVLLAINIGVDFVQEQKAGHALAALKATMAPTALVRRNGIFSKKDASDLVPGDIVKLTIGNIIPADAILREGAYLEVDQSALTGESLPVDVYEGDEVYGNAIVRKGEMLAEVTKTGLDTYIGKSSGLVAQALKTEVSHFERAVIKIGNFLIIFSVFLISLIVLVALLRGDGLLETVRFALVLSVASIPVALPAVLSVTMAVGAFTIAKKHAIVSNLKVIEELAGVDVLCTDKTGTLTKNSMSVDTPRLFNDTDEETLMRYTLLSSTEENNDPIEIPLFLYSKKHGFHVDMDVYKRTDFVPFDPVRKYTEAVVQYGEEVFHIIKGAPQIVAGLLESKEDGDMLMKEVNDYADKGYRTLAVARTKEGINGYLLMGVIPLFDPPRDDSKIVIKALRQAGIKIKMLTGDSVAIARHIADILGIGTKIEDTQPIRKMRDTDSIEDDATTIMEADGFAEVLPEDKYHLVEMLQKDNHIIAMTGDGVNDAPALKKADIGIAVSGATDAARAASDLILLSPGLSVILDALTIARKTFSRMQSYATFRIAETMRVILFMTFSILLFNSYPVTAVMIIVLALLNDIPIMALAYDNAPVHGTPERWNMRETLFIATVLGLIGVVSSFGIFYWLYTAGYSLAIIQTLIFLKLNVAGHSTIYLTRTGRNHFWKRPFPSLKFFIPAFGSQSIGTLIAVFGIFMQPIGWTMSLYIWIYALMWFLINDWVKVWAYKLYDIINGRLLVRDNKKRG